MVSLRFSDCLFDFPVNASRNAPMPVGDGDGHPSGVDPLGVGPLRVSWAETRLTEFPLYCLGALWFGQFYLSFLNYESLTRK